MRASNIVGATGATLNLATTVTAAEVTGALVTVPSLTVTRTLDQVAAVAVAGGGEVQRRARGAGDVEARARPLVARGQRVAVGVVARDVGRQRLVVVTGEAGVIVTVSTTGGVLAGGETVQVNVSVAVRVPSLTVIVDVVRCRRCRERAADDARGGRDR